MRSSDLLALLPDIPRWVGLRGALLSGRGGPVGPAGLDPLTMVVLSPETGFAGVVGRPPARDIQAAAAQVRELVAAPEDAPWVAAALPGWESESATIHVPPRAGLPSGGRPQAAGWLEKADFGLLPPEVANELAIAAARGVPIGAAWSGGRPVSFCYAVAVTETLWDVSVDTLAESRRRGFASRAARFVIEHYARAGRRPVWGAAASNPASAALAAKLGFVPADALRIFTPGGAG